MPNRGMIEWTLMKWCGLRLIWIVNICMKMGTTKMTWNQFVPKWELNILLLILFAACSLSLPSFTQRMTYPTCVHGYKDDIAGFFSRGAIIQQNSGTTWTSRGVLWKAQQPPSNGSVTVVASRTELGDVPQTRGCCPQFGVFAVGCLSKALLSKACPLVDL